MVHRRHRRTKWIECHFDPARRPGTIFSRRGISNIPCGSGMPDKYSSAFRQQERGYRCQPLRRQHLGRGERLRQRDVCRKAVWDTVQCIGGWNPRHERARPPTGRNRSISSRTVPERPCLFRCRRHQLRNIRRGSPPEQRKSQAANWVKDSTPRSALSLLKRCLSA